MGLENELPSQLTGERNILTPSDHEDMENFLAKHIDSIEKVGEHKGFVYFQKESLTFIPSAQEGKENILDIAIPVNKVGTNTFHQRNAYDRDAPDNLKLYTEYENAFFRGEIQATEPFHPEVGARIDITNVTVYEVDGEDYMMVPLVEASPLESGHAKRRYAAYAKNPGSHLIDGDVKPKIASILNAARGAEIPKHEREKVALKDEAVIMSPERIPMGDWTVRMHNEEAKNSSQVMSCHIMRDAETNTLMVFAADKRRVLGSIEDFHVEQQQSIPHMHMYGLAKVSDMAKATQGDTLPLSKVTAGRDPITRESIGDLPRGFRDMIEFGEDGPVLQSFKPVPGMQEFLRLYRQRNGLENALKSPRAEKVANDIRLQLGVANEVFMGGVLKMEKNETEYRLDLPDLSELNILTEGESERFQQWTRKYYNERTRRAKREERKSTIPEKFSPAVRVTPDFIDEEGGFIDVKYGGVQIDQVNRSHLYALIEYYNKKSEFPEEEVELRKMYFISYRDDVALIENLPRSVEHLNLKETSAYKRYLEHADQPESQKLVRAENRLRSLAEDFQKYQKHIKNNTK